MVVVKKCQFFVYLDLVKRGLEITLNDFAEKKETIFVYKKKKNFSKSKKSTFPKGLTHAFVQKMIFFFVFRYGQKKTRNNA